MIEKVGVIGAGAMGNGIAHVCSLAHLDVNLVDISEPQLGKSIETIRGNMGRQLPRNALTEAEREAGIARIHTS